MSLNILIQLMVRVPPLYWSIWSSFFFPHVGPCSGCCESPFLSGYRQSVGLQLTLTSDFIMTDGNNFVKLLVKNKYLNSKANTFNYCMTPV